MHNQPALLFALAIAAAYAAHALLSFLVLLARSNLQWPRAVCESFEYAVIGTLIGLALLHAMPLWTASIG